MRRTRLPNHFGSIRFLGEGRRNAYAVHMPTKHKHTADVAQKDTGCEETFSLNNKRPKAICYTTTWEEGYQVLVLFHAGVISVGDSADDIREKLRRINSTKESAGNPRDKMIKYAKKMLIDLDLIRSGETGMLEEGVQTDAPRTFQEVYDSFIEHRFGPNAGQKRKKSTKNGYHSAWLKMEPFYNMTLDQVSVDALEAQVNLVAGWGYSKTTVQRLVTLIHQLYKYAYDRGYCEGRHGLGVEMPAAKEEIHHQDFTDEEIGKLWKAYENSRDPFVVDMVRMILIMVYSGFRIREYETLVFEDGEVPYFKGGMKTAAGRDRIVPVHSKILPLVRETGGVFLCGKKNGQFRRDMKKVLVQIGVDDAGGCHRKCYGAAQTADDSVGVRSAGESASVDTHSEGAGVDAHGESTKIANVDSENACATIGHVNGRTEKRYHTPHSTRHTFSRLCESYDVKEADRKRMMGHSLKGDITNGTYGHRSVEELRREIEKIDRL